MTLFKNRFWSGAISQFHIKVNTFFCTFTVTWATPEGHRQILHHCRLFGTEQCLLLYFTSTPQSISGKMDFIFCLKWVKCVCKWENKSDGMRLWSEVPIFSSAPIRPANPLRGTKSVARAQNNQTWNASAVEEDPRGREAKMAGTWHHTGKDKTWFNSSFQSRRRPSNIQQWEVSSYTSNNADLLKSESHDVL